MCDNDETVLVDLFYELIDEVNEIRDLVEDAIDQEDLTSLDDVVSRLYDLEIVIDNLAIIAEFGQEDEEFVRNYVLNTFENTDDEDIDDDDELDDDDIDDYDNEDFDDEEYDDEDSEEVDFDMIEANKPKVRFQGLLNYKSK